MYLQKYMDTIRLPYAAAKPKKQYNKIPVDFEQPSYN